MTKKKRIYSQASVTCCISHRYGSDLVNVMDEVEAKTVGQLIQQSNPTWSLYWIGNVLNGRTGFQCTCYSRIGERSVHWLVRANHTQCSTINILDQFILDIHI